MFEVQCDHAQYGKLVRIGSGTTPNTGAGFEHSYVHLNKIDVTPGKPVRKGQKIGESGNTLNVSNHLHCTVFDADGTVTDVPIPDRGNRSNKGVPATQQCETSRMPAGSSAA